MKHWLQTFICITVLLFSSEITLAQQTPTTMEKAHLYSDVITDDNGNPLEGIQVRVRGTGETTKSNNLGEFTVTAKAGDVLIFSKNGQRINTITLNNSNTYRIDDESDQMEAESVEEKTHKKRKISTSKRASRAFRQSQVLIDSAQFYEKTNSDKSIDFIERALRTSEVKNNSALFAKTYATLGNVYANLKQYDLALSSYETSLNSSFSSETAIKKAQMQYALKQYDASVLSFESVQKSNLTNWQKVVVYEGLGDNFKQQQQFEKATKNYNLGLEIAKKHLITPKISDLNTKIGNMYVRQGKAKDAEKFYQTSRSNAKLENVQQRVQNTNSIADTYQQSKNFSKEIELRKETLEELEEADLEEVVVEDDAKVSVQKLNLDIGTAYKNLGSSEEAIGYLEKSAKVANKTADFEVEKNALRQLSELYNASGNSNKALETYKSYAKLVDDLYQQREAEITDAIALNKDLLTKQGRINSLEKDRAINASKYALYQSQQELTNETNKRQKILIYSLLGGLLLLLFAMYAMYKSNKQSKLANNLLALKSLRSQMNPHFIFNALNSVNSFIAQNDERSANRYLTEFSTLMRNVLDNSEEDFIPLSKEIELLQLYIKLEHSRFQDKFEYTIDIDEKLATSEFMIPPMLLQPYVENAVWHGLRYKKEKGNLNIAMQQKDSETIEITISDDGIGRTKSKELKTQNQLKQQSKGMNNIKKRIAILNEMYQDKVDVFIEDLYDDTTGTKVKLILKKD